MPDYTIRIVGQNINQETFDKVRDSLRGIKADVDASGGSARVFTDTMRNAGARGSTPRR